MNGGQQMLSGFLVVLQAALSCMAIALFVTSGVNGQVPGQVQLSTNNSGVSGPFAAPQQGSQYPVCTPAEYGDPTAECIPAGQRTPYDLYGSYGNMTSFGPSPAAEFTSSATTYASQRDEYREPKQTSAVRSIKEPPTEFQRYVAGSTGVMLPIFGASLFEQVPATFAPVDRVPIDPNYVIAPGDELALTLWGQVNVSRRLVVDRSGQVMLPDVGPVSLAGLSYSQAAATFKAIIGRVYKNFDLSVAMGRLHSIQIFVVGEARRPGSYTVSSLSTLVNAVFASGGPSLRGSMRDIQLKRGDQTVCHFDLYDLLIRGDKSHDAQLSPGDVILIPPAGRRVAMVGSIEHPAIYELKDGSTLGDVIRLSDGLSPVAAAKQAVLERVKDKAELEVERIQLSPSGLATKIQNGDVIRLLPLVQRFENAVTLRGNVADAGRFPWHAGMRLSDLIPDKQSLLTREYWKERNHLAVTEVSAGDDVSANSAEDQRNGSEALSPDGPKKITEIAMATARPQPPPFREQERNLQADSSLGAAMGGDSVAPLRSFQPHNFVQPAAPEINWEYAVIERIDQETLQTRIVPFKLGDLVLSHNPSQNLLLEPGDVVTIFSKADFSVPQASQAKQVRLEGEVNMAGVYTLLPGETLRELVRSAGGLTPHAYLYGAQFTRESTRREQQKRYDDFLAQLDREMTESAANLSSRIISPQQALTAQSSVASQHDLIDRLKKVPIDGRIVLDLNPTSRGIDALPDLPLENGDRFYVPSRPSTVNVIGTVFEQATFLYEEDLRVNDYLKKAGGPMRSADRSHTFIVRADGSVVSRSTSNTVLFARGFDTLPMYPGDTLVVPTYVNKTTFARNLMDWSQIAGNFALGAAAINVLH